jgi:hypothetical protein
MIVPLGFLLVEYQHIALTLQSEKGGKLRQE